jgi:hypothetical protein
MATETPAETPEMGRGWETARRAEGAAPAEAPADTEEARAARDAAWMRQVRQARGEEAEPEEAPPPDTRTVSMFASLPTPAWRKAFTEDGAGVGRYVMHAVTWEAKRLVRAAVGASRTGEVDSQRVIKRLKAFVQEQAAFDKDFAHALGAHPVNDATLRGLVQALVGAHSGELAKSMARWRLHEDNLGERMTP